VHQAGADELLEEAHMEDVMETAKGWQGEMQGNVIDQLSNAVRAVEAGLELPFARGWQGDTGVVETQPDALTNGVG
jgi:hypothetical protein